MYTAKMITLLRMYRPRTPMRTFGSSKGIFLLACIITRMMTRLVLRDVRSVCAALL